MKSIERRLTAVPVELRTRDGEPRIGGYAAKFNRLSQNLGGFVESIDPEFFNRSRADGWPDVLARYNHEDGFLLGTTGSGTLRLLIDSVGLDYEVDLPNARGDVLELVQRGDVRKSSFAFYIMPEGDKWGMTEQGFPMRTLLDGILVDVAPVNLPAYSDTNTSMRDATHAYESLARMANASVEEVRKAAAEDNLRRFLSRSDKAPAKKTYGAAALIVIREKELRD